MGQGRAGRAGRRQGGQAAERRAERGQAEAGRGSAARTWERLLSDTKDVKDKPAAAIESASAWRAASSKRRRG